MPKYEIDALGNLFIDGVNGGSLEKIIAEHQGQNALRVREADALNKTHTDERAAEVAALTTKHAAELQARDDAHANAHAAQANAHAAEVAAIAYEVKVASDVISQAAVWCEARTVKGRAALLEKRRAQIKADMYAVEAEAALLMGT